MIRYRLLFIFALFGVIGTVILLNPGQAARGQSGVYAEAKDWLYVRFGAGIDYPNIGTIISGTRHPVLARNADSTWLEIAYPPFVGGRGWIYRDGANVYGDLSSVPVATAPGQGYPTLTVTPPVVVTSVPIWSVTPFSTLSDRVDRLSNRIYDILISNRYIPRTERVGSVFLMDLDTGERYSINPGIAYSGMSLIKLPILVSVYRKLAITPTYEQAQQIALMIICSENEASNDLLRFLGDGDEYLGSQVVTETMRAIGLKDTYLVGPLYVPRTEYGPTATIPPIGVYETSVDQTATNPDRFNQTTPDDLGWLLSALYRCAIDGTGALTKAYPDALNMQKCRAMIRVLGANNIPALLPAGVPDGVTVAHKHGWVDTVLGDAGIILSPGADYVLVVILRDRDWLNYETSFPVIADISRTAFNAFNPADALTEAYTEPIPLCDLNTIDPTLYNDLRAGILPPIR